MLGARILDILKSTRRVFMKSLKQKLGRFKKRIIDFFKNLEGQEYALPQGISGYSTEQLIGLNMGSPKYYL